MAAAGACPTSCGVECHVIANHTYAAELISLLQAGHACCCCCVRMRQGWWWILSWLHSTARQLRLSCVPLCSPCFLQDERTFLHITSWASGSTTLQSVTLMTGPCAALFPEARAEGSNLSSALAPESSPAGGNQVAVDLVSGGSRSGSGCNVYTADNQTVLPLLLDQGALVSREALLVLLQGNVSIAGVQQTPSGRIKLGRPVVLAGLRSVLTGVDFRMTPNILVRCALGPRQLRRRRHAAVQLQALQHMRAQGHHIAIAGTHAHPALSSSSNKACHGGMMCWLHCACAPRQSQPSLCIP
jgi:hypothetical protein